MRLRAANLVSELVAVLWAVAQAQRGMAMLWAPVALGCGIGGYFALMAEPSATLVVVAAAIGGLGVAASLWRGIAALALLAALPLGLALAALHTRLAEAPVLTRPYWGAVEGRLIARDRSASNAVRITLDRVHLPGVPAAQTPRKVRISLAGFIAPGALTPGARVMTQARLAAPNPPVEPGGFDFRRHAWFQQLGGVGYTRNPLVVSDPDPPRGLGVRMFALRMALADGIRARMAPDTGAFAAAILTGDRSAIDPRALEDLRTSNLAHLLAISGLHMGLLTGFVFAAVRIGLALVPRLALRVPAKKIAALCALVAGLGYLMLSGASVATQRAFVMAAVALVAVMLDRPVLTLRAVAISALLVLMLSPVSLTGPGFQMSFAATTALVAAFNGLRTQPLWRRLGEGRGRWLRPVLILAITSFVAGAATAPFSAYHFNGVSRLGYLANLAAVPAMGLLVMPAAVLAGLLAPLGLAAPAFWAMDLGIGHILRVAHWIAARDLALWHVATGPPAVLPLIALGALVVCLMRGRVRVLGLVPVAAALILWAAPDRPALLVAENGRMFGLLTPEGRALSARRGNAFAAGIWLENDGTPGDPVRAYLGAALQVRGKDVTGTLAAKTIHWTGAKTVDPGMCVEKMVLIAPNWAQTPPGACTFIGKRALSDGGAHAFHLSDGRLSAPVTVTATSGQRPWTLPSRR